MDEKNLAALRDTGCCEELVQELENLPSVCARICRLKRYRRDLLERVHAEQRKLEILDYLIHALQEEHTAKE